METIIQKIKENSMDILKLVGRHIGNRFVGNITHTDSSKTHFIIESDGSMFTWGNTEEKRRSILPKLNEISLFMSERI